MQPLVVWTEIPVTDLRKAVPFYNAVFGWDMTITDAGANEVANFGGLTEDDPLTVGGHLYPGKPATGSTVHLGVPGTVEEAAERCTAAGGTVMGPVIEIPPGRFQYATDPDGNSIGLFEPKAA